MKQGFWMAFAFACAAALGTTARADITTLFTGNDYNSVGGGVYFDLDVLNPNGIDIQSLAVNARTSPGKSLSTSIYVRSGTFSGHETSSAGWTLVSTGTGTAAGLNTPSVLSITDFVLGPGLWGVAIGNTNYNAEYTTNAQHSYSTADLSLSLGSSTNALFSTNAIVFKPRVWNGTITYTVASVPEPSTLLLWGIGAAALVPYWVRRRAKAAA